MGSRQFLRRAFQEYMAPTPGPPLRYTVKMDKIPQWLAERFIVLTADEATNAFLQRCSDDAAVWRVIYFRLLRQFYSVTDANGYAGGGQMFVLSAAHLNLLLDAAFPPGTPRPFTPIRLLDIGAGDGNVTAEIAPLFQEASATETSHVMLDRLRARGLRAVYSPLLDEADVGSEPYDMVACLNVLDRCDEPLSLLRRMHALTKPNGGLVLLAVVLPFCPFVEDGSGQKSPKQLLPIRARSFEGALTELVVNVLIPEGYEVLACARVPYLSQCYGQNAHNYALLNDALLLLAPKPHHRDVE